MRVWFCYDFFYHGHRVLVVKIVCCLVFIIVLSSSPIINNFLWPFSVALLYLIGCLLNDVYVIESFLSHLFQFSLSSFGSQLCQGFGRAGSEHFVRTHITEPPCSLLDSKYTIQQNCFGDVNPWTPRRCLLWKLLKLHNFSAHISYNYKNTN